MHKLSSFRVVLGIVVLIGVASSFIGTPVVSAAANQVLTLPLNEGSGTNAADTSGNNNNGTLLNGPTWVPGITGNAVNFAGVDDLVSVNFHGSLNSVSTGVTVAAWVYRNSAQSGLQSILSRQVGTAPYWFEHYYLGFENGNYRWFVNTTNGYSATNVGGGAPLNQWIHLVGTYDGSNARLYVNGILSFTAAKTGTFPADSTGLTIGASHNDLAKTPDEALNGIIDDVRIYDNALTQAEVTQLYNSATITESSVMPLGDSLTVGVVTSTDNGDGGYRKYLWQTIVANGFTNVNFVGSQSGGAPNIDPDHEGYGGATIANIAAIASGRVTTYTPDTILLLIGTNDLIGSSTPQGALNDLGALLNQIHSVRPTARILLANLPGVKITNDFPQITQQEIDEFNAGVPGLVNTRVSQGWNIAFVDLYGDSGLDRTGGSTDFSADGLHFTGTGYSKLAATWYSVLYPDTVPPSVPTGLTTTPVSASRIDLSWNPSTDVVGVTGYRIFRNGSPIATTQGTSYPDVGLTANTTYGYAVAAFDAANNESAPSSPAVPGTTTGTVGLFLHLLLNEGTGTTAVDATGNGNNGTLLNGPTWTAGKSGSAVNFDGNNDSIYVNGSPGINGVTNGVTVAAWVYRNANQNGFRTVISRQVGTAPYYLEHYYLGFENNNYRWFVNTSNGYSDATVGTSAPLGQWVHLVGTYDGTTVRLYVNGIEHFNRPKTGTFVADTTGVAIGSNFNDAAHAVPEESFNGRVDDVRIYGNALTQAEVTQLFNSGGASETTPPSVPTGLTATPASASQINLAWNASTDNVAVTGYRIFRNGTEVGTSLTTTYPDTGLTANTTYGYAVSAYDGSNNESARSTVVSATTTTSGATFMLNLPLDEGAGPTAFDTSGNGNHGTLLNGTFWTAGKTGNALGFDGVNDNVTINGSTSITNVTSAITVAAWVNRNDSQLLQAVVSRQKGTTALEHFFLGFADGGYRWFVATSDNTFSNPNVGSPAPVGQWVHLAGTYDGTSVKLYVNGVLDFTELKTGAFTSESTGIVIGANHNDAAHTPLSLYNGRVDDVRIYNNALTQAEVTQLYQSGNAGAETTPPSVPTGLAATPVSSSRVNLTWNASTDNVGVTGYRIFRDGTAIATSQTTSYLNVGLAGNTTYGYAVAAYDAANNESARSSVVFITTSASSSLVVNLLLNEGTGTTTADATGNGNTGNLFNGPAWTTGKSGGALNFDGINDYVYVNNSTSINSITNAITVSAWVNRNANQSNWRSVVSRQVGTGFLEHYFIGFENNNYRWFVNTSNGSSDSTAGRAATTAADAVGQWVHLVGTYDGAEVKLYVNGVLDFTRSKTGILLSDTTGIAIATNHDDAAHTPEYSLNGKVDDVRIYDYALTGADVTQLYQSGGGAETTPPTVPTGLTATPVSTSTINLSWNASTDNIAVTGYRIFRNGTSIDISPTTTYQDTGLAANTTYGYAVAAFDGSNNESARSSVVSATTPAAGAVFVVNLAMNEGTGSTALDASGFGNHGSLQNGAGWTTGNSGTAVNFDGINDQVVINSSASINSITNAITVAAWVNRSAPATLTFQNVLTRQKGNSEQEHYFLGFDAGRYSWIVNTTAGYSDLLAGQTSAPVGQWVHMVGTYDGTSVKLYVNGILNFTRSLSGTFVADSTGIVLGANHDDAAHTPTQGFFGKIDDVRIYNNALTQAEVTQLYQSTNGGGTETTPPSIPTELSATPVSSSRVNLSWTASTDNIAVTGYRIFRNGTDIGTSQTPSYADLGLAPNTTYNYAVAAYDAANNESARSSLAFATTPVSSALVLNLLVNEGTGTTTADASGNSNTGALLNGTTWTTGKAGSAVNFDGNNDIVLVNSSPSINSISHAITVAAWVNRNAAQSGFRSAVSRQVSGAPFYLEHYYLGFENNNYRWFVNTSSGYSPTNVGTSAAAVGQWVHLVGTYDGTTVRLYVNGVENFNTPKTGIFAPDTTGVVIGGNLNAQVNPQLTPEDSFNGKVDDVRIFDYALSPADVTQLYQNNGGSETTPPSVPTGLTATPISSSQINLAWTASTDNVLVTGYRIFRNGTEVGISTTTTYPDTGLAANTTYGYAVAAYDGSNNESARTAVVSATTSAAAATFVLNLPFSEGTGTTTSDISGSANHGLLNGPAWTTAGHPGNALTFDGINDSVSINNSPSINSIGTGITIAAWVITNHNVGYQTVLTRQVSNSEDEHFFLGFENNRYMWYVRTSDGVYSNFNPSAATATLGQWVHLVGTYDGTSTKLYVNGVLDSSFPRSKTGTLPVDFTGIVLGVSHDDAAHNPLYPLNGKLDEVRIYNNALTQSDVTQLYQSNGGAETTPPSVPTGLTAIPVSASQINLDWADSTDNVAVTGYRIFRDGSPIAISPTSNYSDPGLAANTSYGYAVAAYDAANNESARSSVVSAMTFAGSTTVLNLPLNEGTGTTTSDASGNANNGSLVNGPIWTSGKVSGNALFFDGINDHVLVNNSTSVAAVSHAITVAAWVNRSALQSGFRSVLSRQAGTGTMEHYYLGFENNNYRWFVNTNGDYSAGNAGTAAAPLGQWVHLVGTYDGTNVKLYVNGVENFSVPKSGTFPADTNGISIAANLNGAGHVAGELFNGRIDDVRIYDYALTSTAANQLYLDGGGATVTQSLVSHLAFSEGATTTTADSSGNGNSGSLVNGATWTTRSAGNGAVNLDGINDYVLINSSPTINSVNTGVTVAAWVNRDAIQSGFQSIVSRQVSGAPFYLEQYYLGFENNNYRWFVNTSTGYSPTNLGSTATAAAVGQWVHLVGTYDGTTVRLYVNGAENFNTPKTGVFPADTTGVVIGTNHNDTGLTPEDIFDGKIDDVRIYNYALTGPQVSQLYTATQ